VQQKRCIGTNAKATKGSYWHALSNAVFCKQTTTKSGNCEQINRKEILEKVVKILFIRTYYWITNGYKITMGFWVDFAVLLGCWFCPAIVYQTVIVP
jgi:hypothetical protein